MIIPQIIESEQPLSSADENAKRGDNSKYNFTVPQGRFLVVDDIPVNIRVVAGMLSTYKAAVDTCPGGAEAIEFVKRNTYDIVFMDHMMPGIDGIEATAVIREWEKENERSPVTIVALTANAVAGVREMFLENGFNDFLAKPVEIFKLGEIIARWIPKEKIEKPVSGGGQQAQADEQDGWEEAFSSISNLDVKRGIARTGGTIENYFSVLSMFCRDTEERLPVFQTVPDADTLSFFTTQAHAIKSAAASIGAGEVSSKAAALEAAGRAGDLPKIEENLSGFAAELKELNAGIQKAIMSHNEMKQPRSGENVSPALESLLRELKEALASKKATSDIFNILNEMNKVGLDKENRDFLEKISYHVLMGEFEDAAKIADKFKS